MDKYKEIINLPHKQSTKRPHMSLLDRAAQFAPFAALTGYDDAVKETARLTNEKVELSEENLNVLNMKYQILVDQLDEENEVVFTYFIPDENKDGGAYIEKLGVIKKIDDYERLITLCDGTTIPMDDVLSIDGKIFDNIELT